MSAFTSVRSVTSRSSAASSSASAVSTSSSPSAVSGSSSSPRASRSSSVSPRRRAFSWRESLRPETFFSGLPSAGRTPLAGFSGRTGALASAFATTAFGGGALTGTLRLAGGAAFFAGEAFFSGFAARALGLGSFRACFFAFGFFVISGGSSGFPGGSGDL